MWQFIFIQDVSRCSELHSEKTHVFNIVVVDPMNVSLLLDIQAPTRPAGTHEDKTVGANLHVNLAKRIMSVPFDVATITYQFVENR